MGTTTSTSGSFNNTPQATDDTWTGLTEDSTNIVFLDVMGNDLGGNAKTLYSIDNGISTGTTTQSDLLTQDTARLESTSTDTSRLGAKIWITAEGKVGYDINTISAQIQSLNAGQTLTDTFTYAIRLGNGTLSWATATVVITGVNDPPKIIGTVVGTAIEDGTVVSLNALANASDADSASVLSVVNVPASLPAGVTYDAATHSFKLDPSVAAYQHLAANQTTTVTVSYGVSDGTATTPASVSWTVTGTNDAPTVTSAVTGIAIEDGSMSMLNALANASDMDDGTTLSVVNVPAALPAGVTYDAGMHSFKLDPHDASFQHLAAGQPITVTVNYGISDGTATTAASVSWTVTGTNDAPAVSGAVVGSATEDGAVSTLNALANASDVDDGTTLSVVNVPASLPAGVTYDAATHSFRLDPTDASFQHLAAGQPTTVTVNYGVSDGTATTAASVSWTVTGANDAPVVTGAVVGSATEDGSVSTLNALANASDVDDATTLSVVNVPASLPAGVTYDASTHSFKLDPSDASFQHLAAGQPTTVTVNYGVSDGTATTAASVSWTVTGTNDAPVVSGAVVGSATEDASVSTLNALANASDVDDGTTLSVVNVPASLPAGVTYDASTHSFKLDPSDASFQHLAAGQPTTVTVNYGVSDGTATTAASVSWTVTGTNDAPAVSGAVVGSATEDASASTLNALANVSDVDDGTTLSVVNVPAALPAGVTYDASTHSFKLDPSDASFQHLAAGQPTTVTVNYGVSDGTATTAASLSWTVTGTNDAPVVTGAVVGSAIEDGSVSTLNALANASDVDDGTTLSVVNVPAALPAGVTYDAGTHSFKLDPTDASFQHLAAGQPTTVTVNYGVSDGTATTAASVSWTVTGTNDAPVVTGAVTGSATEDGSVSTLNALANASDVDDGATLSVVNVPAVLPAGVTYDASTHSFKLDPTDASFQHLAAGQPTTVTVNYGVSDGTATTAASVSWTVTGTNDAPAVSGAVVGSATEDGSISTLNALANASDVDDGTTLSVVNVPASLPAGVTYDAGTHSFKLDPSDASFQHLAAGQPTTVTVNYGVSDGTATTAASVSWTVTGTNDAPVVTGAVVGSATEDSAVSTLNALANASDVDDATTLSVVNVPASLPAGVTYDAGTHSFKLDPSDASFQHLAAGQPTTVTVNYGVSDGTATTAASVSWTVTGTNDAPVVTGAVVGSATEDSAVSMLNALANASDVDDATTLSVVNVPAALPAGVTYDAITHSFKLDPSDASFQHLAAGQPTTVTVNYGVSDGTATTAASVSWTVTGTNDAPVVTGAVTGSATEDGSVSTLNALANASDVDDGATLSVVNVPAVLPAGVTYDATTHSFKLDPTDASFQHLAAGQPTTVTVNYGVSDGTATTAASVSWTVTGTNDAPVVTGAVVGSATEDASASTLNALANASDVDDGTTLSVVNVPASLPAGVTYDAATHSFKLDPTDASFQHLAAGQPTTVTVNYGVSDGTATTAASASWTVTGTNDAPAVSGAVVGSATEDGSVSTLNALANASDVDDGTTLSVVNVPASLPAGVTYDVGTHSFKLDPTDASFQHLAAGQPTTVTVSYGVSDGTATTAASVSWTVTGTNDAPVVTGAVVGSAIEDGSISTLNALANASDVDDGTTLSVVNVPASLPAGVTYDASTHSFKLDPSDASFQHLAAGQPTTVTVNYGVSDGTATTAASVSWTVTGTNDAPVVTGAVMGSASEDGSVSTLNALANASDVDDGATLSVVNVPAVLPAGVTYDASTHSFKLDPSDASFQHLAAGQPTTVTVNYGVSDGTATTAASVSWTVTGTNDAPVVTGAVMGSASEDGSVSTLNALANAGDVDDGTTLSVVNVPAVLPAGVTYDAGTHSFKLDPTDASFQHLAAGQPTTVTVNYGVSDGTATTAASASWTVTGTNDAPVVTGAVVGSATEDASASTLNALANASDVDDGTTLSVVNVPASLPAGVTYDVGTHSFKLDPTDASFQHLAAGQPTTVTVSYGVSDGTATTAASVSWTVTGTNDAPVVTGAVVGSAIEDGSISTLNALANASDVDDGTTLSVVNVPASLPAGVTYDASTHSFKLDPSDASFQHLAAGQPTTVTVNYGVSDGTATTAASASWTVTGTNDAPVVSGAVVGSATEDASASTLNALANASDVDDGTTLSVVNVPAALPAGVTYDASTHSFKLDPSDASFQHLAAGQPTTVTVNYGVSDGTATAAASVSWTVTGTNDAPVVTGAVTGSATEDGSVSTLNALANASDVDDGTTLSVVNVPAVLPAGVTYDAGTHSFKLDPTDASFQHLAAGQPTTVTVNYGVSDGTATTAASASWTVTGTNDAPVVTGAVVGSAIEDGSVSTLNALANASDVDDGTTLSVVNVPASLPAGVTYDAATHSFKLDPTDASFQHLAAGQPTTVTVNYGVSDGTATTAASASWTVTGTNDAPVVTGAVVGSATEDASASTLNALANASDVDDGTTLSVVNVPASLPAGVTYDAGTHSFKLDPTDASFQHLAAGQPTTVTVNYGVSDGTATTAASASWTVTGTNDAPVVSGAVVGSATEDGSVSTLNALANTSDIDDGTTLSVVNVPASLPAGVTYDAATHSFKLDPSGTSFQHLAAAQPTTVTVNYGVSDGTATTAASVSWTVTGANDAPVVTGAVVGSATEDGSVSTLNALANASDVDDGATLSVVNVPASLPAGVTYDAASHSFKLDPSVAAYQHLAANQSTTVTVNYGVSDGAATTVASVNWTLAGTNDTPVVAAALTASANEGDASFTRNLLSGASDVDDGETATLSVTNVRYAVNGGASSTTAPAGVSVAGATLTIDPTNAAFDALAAGATASIVVSYDVKDAQGATVAQTETITIAGKNDAPVANADLIVVSNNTTGATISAAALLGNDVDADGNALTITSVGSPSAGVSGLTQSNGNIVFNTDGTTNDHTFTYTVSDGITTSTATVTMRMVQTSNSNGNPDSVDLSQATYNGYVASYIDLQNGGDTATGAGAASDTFVGGGGDDMLRGGLGNDRLVGGAGNDTLTGGGGSDTFVFNAALSASNNVDTIKDFSVAENDFLLLTSGVVPGLSTVASPNGTVLAVADFASVSSNGDTASVTGTAPRLIYDTGSGNLYYDSNGGNGGGRTLITHVENGGVAAAVDASHILIGS